MKKDEAHELYDRSSRQKKEAFWDEVYCKIRQAALNGEAFTCIAFPALLFDMDEAIEELRKNGYIAHRSFLNTTELGHRIHIRWDR